MVFRCCCYCCFSSNSTSQSGVHIDSETLDLVYLRTHLWTAPLDSYTKWLFGLKLKPKWIEDNKQVTRFGCLDDNDHELWPFLDHLRFPCEAISGLNKMTLLKNKATSLRRLKAPRLSYIPSLTTKRWKIREKMKCFSFQWCPFFNIRAKTIFTFYFLCLAHTISHSASFISSS